MEKGVSRLGLGKHRKMGVVPSAQHFTGKKGGKAQRNKKSTRKQRQLKRGSHVNKYAHLVGSV